MLRPAFLIMTSFQQLLTFHFIELSVYLCEKCNRIQSSVTHQSIHVAFGNNQHNKVRKKKSPITIFQNTMTFSYSNSSTYDKCSYNDSRAPFLSQIHLHRSCGLVQLQNTYDLTNRSSSFLPGWQFL